MGQKAGEVPRLALWRISFPEAMSGVSIYLSCLTWSLTLGCGVTAPTVRKPERFSGRKLSAHFPLRSSDACSGHAAVLRRQQEETLGRFRLRLSTISLPSWVILSPPRPPPAGGGQRGEVRTSCRRTASARRRLGAR